MNEMRTIGRGSTGVLLLFFAVVGLCQTREERRAAAALKPAVEAECARLVRDGHLSDALDRYLELFALDVRSKQFTAHNIIPRLAVAIGRFDAAAYTFEKFPRSENGGLAGFDTEPFMALCLAKCGRWADARKAYSAESVRRDLPDVSRSECFPAYGSQSGFLALCWERCAVASVRDPDRQILYLNRAHEADPKNLWIMDRLAHAQFDAMYYQDCIKTCTKIIAIDPKFDGSKARIMSCNMLIERGESRTMPDPSKFKTKF